MPLGEPHAQLSPYRNAIDELATIAARADDADAISRRIGLGMPLMPPPAAA